ncbi:hypothetical protein ACXA45_01850 [Neomicrococcus lactis]
MSAQTRGGVRACSARSVLGSRSGQEVEAVEEAEELEPLVEAGAEEADDESELLEAELDESDDPDVAEAAAVAGAEALVVLPRESLR